MPKCGSDIYPGCKAMTESDAMRMDALNRKNAWGMSYRELKNACDAHQYARNHGDIRRMEMIEYRLTDINFHHECGMLHRGEYDALREELKGK